MADITLKVILKDANIAEATDDFLTIHPMPQIPDPNWVDPKDGSTPPMVNKYASTKAWAEAYLINHMWYQLERGAIKKYKKNRQARTKSDYVS